MFAKTLQINILVVTINLGVHLTPTTSRSLFFYPHNADGRSYETPQASVINVSYLQFLPNASSLWRLISLNIAYLTVEVIIDIESIIIFSFSSCKRRKWLKWYSLLKYPTSLRWIRWWRWCRLWGMIRSSMW